MIGGDLELLGDGLTMLLHKDDTNEAEAAMRVVSELIIFAHSWIEAVKNRK